MVVAAAMFLRCRLLLQAHWQADLEAGAAAGATRAGQAKAQGGQTGGFVLGLGPPGDMLHKAAGASSACM